MEFTSTSRRSTPRRRRLLQRIGRGGVSLSPAGLPRCSREIFLSRRGAGIVVVVPGGANILGHARARVVIGFLGLLVADHGQAVLLSVARGPVDALSLRQADQRRA